MAGNLLSRAVLRTGTRGPHPRAEPLATWGTLLNLAVTDPGLEGGASSPDSTVPGHYPGLEALTTRV